jgi:hypothetical protein
MAWFGHSGSHMSQLMHFFVMSSDISETYLNNNQYVALG